MDTAMKPHWQQDSKNAVLHSIHDEHVNVAIFDRDTSHLTKTISWFIKQDLHFQSAGDKESILHELNQNREHIAPLIDDMEECLQLFLQISGSQKARLILATVETDMCSRFHADVNTLRMLCTYAGPGTQWLREDNIRWEALDSWAGNEEIVRDENEIQQVPTGAVAIIKGSMYSASEVRGAVHKSPSIPKKW